MNIDVPIVDIPSRTKIVPVQKCTVIKVVIYVRVENLHPCTEDRNLDWRIMLF